MKKLTHTENPVPLRAEQYKAENDVAEFADAYYWQARGNPAPMEAWLAKRDEIKQRFPKAK